MSDNDIGYMVKVGWDATAFLIRGSAVLVKEAMKLIQWAVRQHKAGKLSANDFSDIKEFIKLTDGKIEYLNIPAESAEYIRQVEADLKKMRVPYYLLPDLNTGDNLIQIMYHADYSQVVMPWYQTYCQNRLHDGTLKGEKTITALAGGEAKTGIFVIPTEDEALLREMQSDLEKMNVSCSLLKDTNIGDGTREVLYPKQDEEKVQKWLEAFCQKNIIRGGEKSYQELQNIAENKTQVGFINIPGKDAEVIDKMHREFGMLGINYHVVNDMRTGEGQLQVLYLEKDAVLVKNWYANFAADQLIKGGEKEYIDLINLTNGRTQIVSLPFDGEHVREMTADFDALHINYAFLPALSTAGNTTYMMYASADAGRLHAWYELYQDNLMNETGEQIPNLRVVDEETYINSAKGSAQAYIDTEAVALPPPEPKKKPPLADNPHYQQMLAMSDYAKVTINAKLVTHIDEQTFISRIPYEQDRFLVLPPDRVFETDFSQGESQTYIAFINSNGSDPIVDAKGEQLKQIAVEEILGQYETVKRTFQEVRDVVRKSIPGP